MHRCTLDTSTTHTTPAVIHVPGQVKRAASQIALPLAKMQKHHAVTLDNFVMQTIASEKAAIDIQITRFICIEIDAALEFCSRNYPSC